MTHLGSIFPVAFSYILKGRFQITLRRRLRMKRIRINANAYAKTAKRDSNIITLFLHHILRSNTSRLVSAEEFCHMEYWGPNIPSIKVKVFQRGIDIPLRVVI
jgi:hypothetical protein